MENEHDTRITKWNSTFSQGLHWPLLTLYVCGFVLYGGSFRSTPPLSKAVEAKVEFEERWFLSKVLFLDLLFNCFDHPLV